MTTASTRLLPPWTRLQSVLAAVAATVVHMLMTLSIFRYGGELHTGEFLLSGALSLAEGVVLFLYLVPRGGAVGAFVLAVASLLTVTLFWTGLPMPLAAAAAVIGWRARRSGDRPGLALAALAVCVLAVLAFAGLAITDDTT